MTVSVGMAAATGTLIGYVGQEMMRLLTMAIVRDCSLLSLCGVIVFDFFSSYPQLRVTQCIRPVLDTNNDRENWFKIQRFIW